MADEQRVDHVPSICGGGPGYGPPFGRKVAGCPRCDQLLAGAAPRALSPHRQAMVDAHMRRQGIDEQNLRDMREHFASVEHRGGLCNNGGLCTKFDW